MEVYSYNFLTVKMYTIYGFHFFVDLPTDELIKLAKMVGIMHDADYACTINCI